MPTVRAAAALRSRSPIDSRERYPYRFADRPVTTQRSALAIGDYAVLGGEQSRGGDRAQDVEDLVSRSIDGTLGFQLAELAALPAAAVVVEERYAALAAAPRVTPGWPCELAPSSRSVTRVPIVFADSRKLAEDWTHRFLAAAAALHADA